jgi:hypothetical protein
MWQCARITGVFAVGMTVFLVFASSLPDFAKAGDVVGVAPQAALVQFRSFMAPIAQPGKKPGMKAVTVIVEVRQSDADNVCSSLPRIRDAVLVELFREPIAVGQGTGMDVRPVEVRLLQPVNRALGNAVVRRVYVIPGSEHTAEATAARLPYPRLVDCRPPRSRKA